MVEAAGIEPYRVFIWKMPDAKPNLRRYRFARGIAGSVPHLHRVRILKENAGIGARGSLPCRAQFA